MTQSVWAKIRNRIYLRGIHSAIDNIIQTIQDGFTELSKKLQQRGENMITDIEKAVSLISQVIITLVGLISIWDRLNGKK